MVDPDSGEQPIYNADRTVVLAANGEIYNHGAVREELKDSYAWQTKSDCEAIIPLYAKHGMEGAVRRLGAHLYQ